VDLVITPRGKIIPYLGELPTESDPAQLQLMYFRTALIDAIRSPDLGIVRRSSQLRSPDELAAIEIDIRRLLIEKLLASPFGSDFEPSLIAITTYEGDDDTLKVDTTYGRDTAEAIRIGIDINIEGGTLVLDDEPLATYSILDIDPVLMTEEIIVEEATNIIELCTEASSFVVITNNGERTRTITFTGNTDDYPDDNRYTAEVYNVLEERIIEIGKKANVEGGGIDGISDEIFLSSMVNIGKDDFVISITDNSGNITNQTYIPEADDYILRLDTSDHNVDLTIEVITALASAEQTTTIETTSTDLNRYPFPYDHIRGPRLAELNRVLEPGLYTAMYIALIKQDYDASMISRS